MPKSKRTRAGKKESNPVGRPTVIDEITLLKLEEAYANHATDEQACFIANIGQSTLYKYQEDHPEFIERKRALKAMIGYQAKANIRRKIESGDLPTSQWWSERREKEDFSQRNELTGKDGDPLQCGVIAYPTKNEVPLGATTKTNDGAVKD